MLVLGPAPTLAEEAYARVESMIVTLQLEPGAVFSEGNLAESLDMGRTPLREALQRLASDGLITAIARRGMMVSPIDLPEMLSVIQARKALDAIVHSGAALKATDGERNEIRQARQALVAADGGAMHFMEADYNLDKAIWDAAPNQFAVNATRPLHAHCRRFWFRHREDDDLRRSADLHDGVVEAVIRGDAVAARERSDKLMDYLTLFTKHILIAA